MKRGLVEKGLLDPRLAGKDLIPMISAFLGAKTLASKHLELEYARSIGARRVLYHFDSLNLKKGQMTAFAAEIEELCRWRDRLEPIVFLPVFHFDDEELRFATQCLVDSGLAVMLCVESFADALGKPFARLVAAFAEGKVYAALPDRPAPEEATSLPGQTGLLGWAHFG